MCAVDKPPRPKGVKAYDIDRFDLPVDIHDVIIYGSDFVGTQEEYESHIIKQMSELETITIDSVLIDIVNTKKLLECYIHSDPMFDYVESLDYAR